jgi:ubiquinone/menaquinone biosynthesis C-methylase UbiE
MNAYDADFAALYDVFYGDKPYDAEAKFLDDLLRERGSERRGRLLDVACGTGQHAVRLADAGWTVVGVDQSAAMLTQAHARRGNRQVIFYEQDMTALQIDEPPFDAAVCLFDSIGYAITNERIGATLAGIKRHLKPRGALVLEFWHAAAMLTSYDPRRERTWRVDDGSIRRTSQTTLDVLRQVARVQYGVERRDAKGQLVARWTEVHENRFFLVQEMRLLLEASGYVLDGQFAGYDREAQIDVDTWHVLAIAHVREATTV